MLLNVGLNGKCCLCPQTENYSALRARLPYTTPVCSQFVGRSEHTCGPVVNELQRALNPKPSHHSLKYLLNRSLLIIKKQINNDLTILIVLSCLIFQAIVIVHRISRTPHRNTLVNTNMFIVGLSCVNINLPVVSLARDFYQYKKHVKLYRSASIFDL